MTGYIYAIESGGRVKIGFSMDPEKRVNKIASDAPFPCELLGYWPGSVSDELAVQEKFNAIRVHGEWFAATADLLAFVSENVIARHPKGGQRRFKIADTDNELAVWRKSQRLPMDEFAKELGVTVPVWWTWERGKRPVPATRVRAVSELTGIPPETLRPDIFGRVD